MPLTATVQLEVLATLSLAGDFSTPEVALDYTKLHNFQNGTGLNQCNLMWQDQRTLGDGASETLDLAGLLAGLFGPVLNCDVLKTIFFYSLPANTTNLTISRPDPAGVPFFEATLDSFVLAPGGLFLLTDPSAAGINVTAATGDLITIVNAAGASATYDVILLGETV